MKPINSLANHLLIAMPSLDDPFFSKSVTYICEHNKEGALGLVINQPLESSYQELFEHLKIPQIASNLLNKPLLAGGPVDRERGFILHRPRGQWQSSLYVTEDITLSTSEDILHSIAQSAEPQQVLISLGYAGWQANQLEEELKENTWLFVEATPEILFETPTDEIWLKSAQLLGVDLNQISALEGHA